MLSIPIAMCAWNRPYLFITWTTLHKNVMAERMVFTATFAVALIYVY